MIERMTFLEINNFLCSFFILLQYNQYQTMQYIYYLNIYIYTHTRARARARIYMQIHIYVYI